MHACAKGGKIFSGYHKKMLNGKFLKLDPIRIKRKPLEYVKLENTPLRV